MTKIYTAKLTLNVKAMYVRVMNVNRISSGKKGELTF